MCVPNYEATCWLWGDPHYHSFDGWDFDFQGTCNYVLAAAGPEGGSSQDLTPFTVTTKNENRGNPAVSYVRLVTVSALGFNISIHKGEVGKVRVSQAAWPLEPPGGGERSCQPRLGAEGSLLAEALNKTTAKATIIRANIISLLGIKRAQPFAKGFDVGLQPLPF